MKQSEFNSLLSISPIDGRYRYLTEDLYNFFSEYAVFKYRIIVEIKYLIALSEIGIIRKFTSNEIKILNSIVSNFDFKEANKIKATEKIVRHDKKALEYYLKEYLEKTSVKNVLEFIHFGLTSYDVENIVHRLELKDSLEKILLPRLISLSKQILVEARKYNNLPMLARTHGQPAIPTTLGKEYLNFYERLKIEIDILKQIKFRAKLNGAVGNYNAHYFVYPKVNWEKFSKDFLKEFGLDQHPSTTQIAPYDDIIFFFQTIQRINNIILGFDQDMWRYISDNWFIQENVKEKVGSSTMPQKINPINFEQSEGNIIVANSLIDGFTNKLGVSRLQRDLSDSTIARNFGVTLAHSLLAYQLSQKGLSKITPNKEKINEELNRDWAILSEAVQIYLKKEGVKNGYEIMKDLTRGEKMSQESFQNMINKLPLNDGQKSELRKLTPEKYLKF